MLITTLSNLRKFLIIVGLLPIIKRILYAPKNNLPKLTSSTGFFYWVRSLIERANFHGCSKVDDLPPIHHYWDEKFIRPRLAKLGYLSEDDFYLKNILRITDKKTFFRCVSIGVGNCEFEIRLAKNLLGAGYLDFNIECMDFNEAMLLRGQDLARSEGVDNYILPVREDFNKWHAELEYDVVIARWSLHHVLNLEILFDQIKGALKSSGIFLSSDMIGRNGHMRWPEVLEIVNEYWSNLPSQYKFNTQLGKQMDEYENFDCSRVGFEGIRAQDILPLLLARFHFEVFMGFGGIVDPFVDRAIGANFNPMNEDDRHFIDAICLRETEEFHKGKIKPTQMYACMTKIKTEKEAYLDTMSAQFAVRKT